MRRLIPTIDRYVLRELLGPLSLCIPVLTFFLFINRIYNFADLVITRGVPFPLVAKLLLFMVPSFLALTLPMAVLVAVLLAGGRMAADLEVVAVQALGISPVRLFRPAAALAAAATIASGALTIVVMPVANREFQAQLFEIVQARAAAGLKERVFNADFGDIVIYPDAIGASHSVLRGLLVSDERDPTLTRIITARAGRLLSDPTNGRVILRLQDGAVNEADVLPAVPTGSDAGTVATVPPPPDVASGGAAAAGRYRYTAFDVYDIGLPIHPRTRDGRLERPECASPIDTCRSRAQFGGAPVDDYSLVELEAHIAMFADQPERRLPFEIEWHKRFAFPLAALVFAAVGFPLAIRSPRGGRALALVGSLVILSVYYLLLTALESAALRGRIPPWAAIWTPNIVFGAVGALLIIGLVRDVRWEGVRSGWRFTVVPAAWPRRRSSRRRSQRVGVEASHIVDRYLLRSQAAFILMGLAVAAALFLVVDLAETLDRFLRMKPPLVYIVEHFCYRLPAWLHEGLPIVMLVATIFLFLTLMRNHELTALKAAGVSLYRVSAPVIALGLGVAGVAAVFQEAVLPLINERGDHVDRVKIRGQLPRHMQVRSRLWLRASDTRFYRVELLEPGASTLHGVTILELTRDFRLQSRLDARRAQWSGDAWVLTDGAFREAVGDGRIESVPFTVATLNVSERIEDFTQVEKPLSAMNYRELSDYVRKLEAAGFHAQKYWVELYAKLSFPLVNGIMVLVAIPFALHAARTTRIAGIALAIVIMVAYVVVHEAAVALARAELLPPMLAAWAANVIFTGLGCSLLARVRT